MTEIAVGTRRKFYCNTCKGQTHHELKAVHCRSYNEYPLDIGADVEWYDEMPSQAPIYGEDYEYRLWACCGCDSGTLEIAYNMMGQTDPATGELVWRSSLHPRRVTGSMRRKRFVRLIPKLKLIYKEVIDSYNSNIYVLCAIGLRALLEGICAEKEVQGRDLFHKIDGLRDFLPSNIVDGLHSFRFIGNTAAHELIAPSQDELELAIEVIEDLLNFLYELEYKTRRLPNQSTKRAIELPKQIVSEE